VVKDSGEVNTKAGCVKTRGQRQWWSKHEGGICKDTWTKTVVKYRP